MVHASGKGTINTSADAIRQVIGDFGVACQYLVMVIDCMVAGQDNCELRTLNYTDGSTIVETTYRLSYALLSDTPFRDCLTTVTMHDLGPGQCEVTWSATFEADGLPAGEAQQMLEGAFGQNGRALKHFLAAQGAVIG